MAATIEELDEIIKGLRSLIQCTRTMLACPEATQRSIDEDLRSIAVLQKRVAQRQEQLADGPDLIDRTKARLAALTRQRAMLEHQRQVAQLLSLVDKVEELTS